MLLSKFLLYERYVLITKLTSVDVTKLISTTLLPQQNSEALYQGEITRDAFRITRISKYRNSFLPIIKGKISAVLNRTEISITMKPPVSTVIFLLIWICFTGVGCLKVIFPGLFNLSNEDKPIWFLPFLFLSGGYLIAILSFKSESRKSKQFLEMLLEVEEYR